MNKISTKILFLFLFALTLVTACKKDDDPQVYKFKVAMLAEGNTFDDLSFLQNCKQGLEKAKGEFDLEVEYNISTVTNDYQERINSYCDLNYDLVIAIGYMWNYAVANAATAYPNTKFIIVDTELSQTKSNVVSIVFDVDEAAFPIGFLSAWWADTQTEGDAKIGYVGAMAIPQIRQFAEPFGAGAMHYNQQYERNVGVVGDYVGDFFNSEAGQHISDSLIGIGADVIFGVGSETGNGALLKANELGKVCIGVDVDQYYSFPEVADKLLSSAMKNLDNAIYEVVSSFVDNTFAGGTVYNGKLENKGVDFAPFHDYKDIIADSIKIELEEIRMGIIGGEISTGW